MPEEDVYEWQYIVAHEAYYWGGALHTSNVTHEVWVDHTNVTGGGTRCEFVFKWHDLGSHRKEVAPTINIFDESWSVFAERPDLFAALAAAAPEMGGDFQVSPEHLIDILDSLGFVDATKREAPEGSKPVLTIEEKLATALAALEKISEVASEVRDSQDYQECSYANFAIGNAAVAAVEEIS